MDQSTSKRKDGVTCVQRELRSSKRKKREREEEKRTKENLQSATSDQAADLREPLLSDEQCTGKKLQFLTELKSKYRILCEGIQPVRFQCDKYDIDKLFVTSRIKFLEEKNGEPRRYEKWTNLEDYKAIFTDPKTKSKRRIIDGKPGYGKSMLALKMTNDWCKGRAPMKDFQLLILLQLKQFRNVPSIYSAIKTFLLPKDTTLTEDDIKDILDSSSTVVLLDGYDEYPERGSEDTDIVHILQGDMFQKHEVILITRTSCLPPNHANATIKRFQLTGFDEPSRERYIQKMVAPGRPGIATKLSKFFKVCSVPANICQIPLLFVMMTHLVKKSGSFLDFKTVTQWFRYIIKCFHTHKEGTEGNQEKELDHRKLDRVAFEGLSESVQQISWGKNKLIGQIGKDLYEEYVRIGILIEEESFNYDSLEYYTQTGFCHKMYAEWYAACRLARKAAPPGVQLGPCQKPSSEANDTQKVHETETRGKVFNISLDPHDDFHVYRYACGMNPKAAQKIIKHLGTNGNHDENTLLCMAEYNGSLASIEDTVMLLCSRGIGISGTDSLLLQKSTVAVMEFSSSRKPGPDITVFVEQPSEKLFCLLCKNIFRDPVITDCGHTYCKQCATSKHFGTCPVDKYSLSWTIKRNILVRELVEELVIHCRYGCKLSADKSSNKYEVDPNGCPCTFPLKDRSEHESRCEFASRSRSSNTGCPPLVRMIPIHNVYLSNCLDVNNHGNLCLKPSNLSLPVINTLRSLDISEHGREITEEEMDSILKYAAMCPELEDISFDNCLLPQYIKVTESLSDLERRHVKVQWRCGNDFELNLDSGQWEESDHTPMTDEYYLEDASCIFTSYNAVVDLTTAGGVDVLSQVRRGEETATGNSLKRRRIICLDIQKD